MKYLAIISIIIVSIFSYILLLNEYRLWKFSNQLDNIEEYFRHKMINIASGSNILVSGNDEACTFQATRAYKYFDPESKIHDIVNRIESTDFETAHTSSNEKNQVETYVYASGFLIIVTIQDGPYSAGLDFRCW